MQMVTEFGTVVPRGGSVRVPFSRRIETHAWNQRELAIHVLTLVLSGVHGNPVLVPIQERMVVGWSLPWVVRILPKMILAGTCMFPKRLVH